MGLDWSRFARNLSKILLKSVRNYRIGDVDLDIDLDANLNVNLNVDLDANLNVDLNLNIEMKYLKAIWRLCSYLFWPQRRPR